MNNIKKLLKDKDLSILKLSEISGITYANTHNLVNRPGLGSTTLETLIKVADVLGVEIKNLYSDDKNKD